VKTTLKIEHRVTTFLARLPVHGKTATGLNWRRLSGEGRSAMNQPDALQRLDAALDELESHLQQVFAESDGDVSLAALKEQVRFLTEERDQLLDDLEAERSRVRRLKAANDEVSDRLEAVMGTLKDMMPAVPG
jgi:chromosome segregation ATPase